MADVNVFRNVSITDKTFRDLAGYDDKVVVINKFLTELGIEQVANPQILNEDNGVFTKMTLVVDSMPSGKWQVHLNEKGKEDVEEYKALWEPFDKFRKTLLGVSSYFTVCRFEKTAVMLKNSEGSMIGFYYPERNLLWLCYNPFQRWWKEVKASDLLDSFKPLKDALIEVKIVKVDVTDKLLEKKIEEFKAGIKKEEDRVKASVSNYDASIKDYRSRLIEAENNYFLTKKSLDNFEAIKKSIGDVLKDEVKKVAKFPFVQSVEFDNNGIKVNVGKVSMLWKGEKVFMGEYSFVINPSDIRLQNPYAVKKSGGNYEHPHCHDGVLCFGSAETNIYTLLGSLQLTKLVFELYRMLKTYNASSPHCEMEYWVLQRKDKFDGEGNVLKAVKAEAK